MLASHDSMAQFCGNRDEIKERASMNHCDARDGHGIQGFKAKVHAQLVVILKGCYGLCNDPVLYIEHSRRGVVTREHHEDKGLAMEKACIWPSNMIAFATSNERNGAICGYSHATFIKACEL